MKKWVVIFEVFRGKNPEIKKIQVEAGNKKIAMIRAMMEINKDSEYANLFKKAVDVKEVA